MPAGGIWTAQNKVRPGAYVNFKSVPSPVGTLGSRGTMICALPMTWGPSATLITLYGSDLLDGKSLTKIGCTAFDTIESLPFRMALAGCSKALLFRSDAGGIKATKNLSAGSLDATAKYAGTTGNSLTVAITADKPTLGKFTVEVLFKNILRESFIVEVLADFSAIESEWIDFIVAGTPSSSVIPETVGVSLETGTNGSVSTSVYTDFFDLANGAQWQCLAINADEAEVAPLIVTFIKMLRDDRGKKVQAVVYDAEDSDYEGIISVHQGFKTAVDTVPVDLFPLWVASITAGAQINESNTARVVPGAIEITTPVDEEDIEDALNAGKFILSYRQDGAVCVEKDINTLSTFTVDKGYAFSKNRLIRCLDEIANTTALVFNRNYCGKVNNDAIGRNLYKTELISFIDKLVGLGAIQNFGGAADVVVLPGQSIDSVVVDLTIQPVDSMEFLYMTVNVDA